MRLARLLTACLISATAGCGSGSNDSSSASPTGPTITEAPSITYEGTVAGTGSHSGTISVTVRGSAASGALRLAGSTTNLTGTADAGGTNVSLSGGGFSFSGSVASGALNGTYTGPSNTSGRFSTLNATTATVTRYCGTYNTVAQLSGGGTYTESGTFNLQVSSNGTVTGTAATVSPEPACCEALTGTVSGSSITVTSAQGGGGTGTIGGGTVSGTGSVQSGRGSVTFSGSTAACP